NAVNILIFVNQLSNGFVQQALLHVRDTLKQNRAVKDNDSLRKLNANQLRLAFQIANAELESVPGDEAENFNAIKAALDVHTVEEVQDRLSHPVLRDHFL